MNKREGAIISAYTGIMIGSFSGLHEYVEDIMGGPIFTHQFPALRDEIKEKSKKDFIELNKNIVKG